MADEDAKTQKKFDYHPCKNEEMTLLKCIDESNHIFWRAQIKATDIPNPAAPNRSTINTAAYEILQGDEVLAAIPEQKYANSFDILSGLKIDKSKESLKNALTDLLNNPSKESAQTLLDLIKPKPITDSELNATAKKQLVNDLAKEIVGYRKGHLSDRSKENNINELYSQYPKYRSEIEARVEELMHPSKKSRSKRSDNSVEEEKAE